MHTVRHSSVFKCKRAVPWRATEQTTATLWPSNALTQTARCAETLTSTGVDRVKSACTELAPCHTRAVNVLEGLVIFLEYSRHGMCYLVWADGRARPDKDPIQVVQPLSAATVCHTVVRVTYTISLSGHLRSRRIQQNLLQHLNMPQGCNRRDTPAETTASQIGVFVRRVRKGRSLCDVHNAIYGCGI